MLCWIVYPLNTYHRYRSSSHYHVWNQLDFQSRTSDSARRTEFEAAPNQEDDLSLGQVDLISLAETLSTAEWIKKWAEGVCMFWQRADQASWCQEVQRGLPACWLTLKSALIHFREAMDDSVYIKVDLSDCAFDRDRPIRALSLLSNQDQPSLVLFISLLISLSHKNLLIWSSLLDHCELFLFV